MTPSAPTSPVRQVSHPLSSSATTATPFVFAPTSPQRYANPNVAAAAVPRLSPRQVKLQRVEPPAYALRFTLRDHVAANFQHELFQFHQTLRDVVARSERHTTTFEAPQQTHKRRSTSVSPPTSPYDRSVLELLTSDRGDAVLKELFHRWQLKRNNSSTVPDANDDDGNHDGCVLWDVLETFFKSVPLVLPESEVSNAKSYFRYVDALKSLRDVLLALLYKTPRKSKDNDEVSDEDESTGVRPSDSLAFLLGSTSRMALPKDSSSQPQQPRPPRARLLPMHVYCRQLERELSKLRQRHPNRSRVAGFRASLKRSELHDVGLLNDATVLLLLDFWELPKTERLGFFCQIASQARDEDAAMLLRVFLDNCSTHNFLQVWEALQQAPQFKSTFALAARQYCAALRHDGGDIEGDSTGLAVDPPDAEESAVKSKTMARDRVRERRTTRTTRHRPSLKNGLYARQRASRFVDLSGLTEVFEEREDVSESPLGGSDSSSGSDDNSADGRQFRQILIRERGRTPPDQRLNRPHRRRHHPNTRNDDHQQLPPVSPIETRANRGVSSPYQLPPVNLHAPLLQRLHADLVELIKLDARAESDGTSTPPASAPVLDMVWKLLELLDKDNERASGSFHRINARTASATNGSSTGLYRVDSVVSTSTAGQDPTLHRPTLLLDANLSRDQQFAFKLDQLQSLLTALGAFSLHEMETETIASAYRRMPAFVKLFSAVHEKTHAAAGVDTSSDVAYSKINVVVSATQQENRHASVASPPASERSTSIAPVVLSASDGQVLEAASLLMAKVGKIVRSLADLDQLSASASRDTGDNGVNLDVLALLKLADDMESDVFASEGDRPGGIAGSVGAGGSGGVEPDNSAGGNRRGTLIDHSRRLAILHKLKALATSAEIDAVAGMVSETVKDAREHQVQQFEQLEQLSSAVNMKPRRRRASRFEGGFDTEALTGSGDSDDDDGADEVLKMARKAKTRRASEVVAASKSQHHQPSMPADSDESDDESSSRPHALTSRRDVLLPFRLTNTAQKGVKLFSVGILLRIVYQVGSIVSPVLELLACYVSLTCVLCYANAFRSTARATKGWWRRPSTAVDAWALASSSTTGTSASAWPVIHGSVSHHLVRTETHLGD